MSILRSWRGTGEDGSQFLWRRNPEEKVMSKLKTVDSKLFLFSFSFSSQIIFLSNLRTMIRVTRSCGHTSVTSDNIVTSHEIYKRT